MSSIFKREWTTKAGEKRVSWRVQFYVAGKPRKRDFRSRPLAKRFADRVVLATERELKEAKEGRGPRIEQVVREWLAACARGRNGEPPLEHQTVVWYQSIATNWLLPAFGQSRIAALSLPMVKEFRDSLIAPDVSIGRRTAKKVLATLKTLIGFAIEEGYLTSDPSAKVGIRLSSRDRAEVVIHSRAEMTAILAAADRLRASQNRQVSKTWSRYYPMLLILVYAGLRLSEARGLERDAVDTTARVIHVRQRADKRGVIGPPKSAKGTRRIHVPETVTEAIRELLRTHNHPLVFATSAGRPVDGTNIRENLWHAVQEAAGVRVLTLHSARHFFASREIERGTNLKELCDLMGHADESFTLKTYGHLFRDKASEARRRQSAEDRILV